MPDGFEVYYSVNGSHNKFIDVKNRYILIEYTSIKSNFDIRMKSTVANVMPLNVRELLERKHGICMVIMFDMMKFKEKLLIIMFITI